MRLPEEFKERMKQMLGEAEYGAFLQCFDEMPHKSLRMNPLKGDGRAAIQRTGFSTSRVTWEENGYYYAPEDPAGKHPYHEAGVYYIQEASAMLPAALLGPAPGERVLDLCAAPGGKSTQAAGCMRGEGLLICNEIHPARAKILSGNIERMGVRNAIVTSETPQRLAERFPCFFDAILVDAPCSGEGMFRKNEDACEEWSPRNVMLCADRQDEILECAAKMLRPGGRLVYSTCTFSPEENEGSVSRFLHTHPDFSVQETAAGDWGVDYGVPSFVGEPARGIEKTIRLWPHKIKGEGHFAALLVREDADGEWKGTLEKGISPKEYRDFLDFQQENLQTAFEGVFLKFGEQLYVAPSGTPSLSGLKVLRPGLHLGTMRKGRFEPSHALALALSPEEARFRYHFSAEDEGIRNYLSGHTFQADGEKGWYLVMADEYGIGWGKLAGGIMKNHYPKGLRRDL